MDGFSAFCSAFSSVACLPLPAISGLEKSVLSGKPHDKRRRNITNGLNRYKIHYGPVSRGTKSAPTTFQYQSAVAISSGQTSHTLTGLTTGQLYYISVTALDTTGNESKFSNEVSAVAQNSGATTSLLVAQFSSGAEGFQYVDDTFRQTKQPAYASGTVTSGTLQVTLGGLDSTTITGMSGGWRKSFTVGSPSAVPVTVTFRYHLTQTPHYESDEFSEVPVTVGTIQPGTGGQDFVARLTGNGNGGPAESTGWQTFTTTLTLAPGSYALTLGAYHNKKTASNEAPPSSSMMSVCIRPRQRQAWCRSGWKPRQDNLPPR
jgi:hypothetical protein